MNENKPAELYNMTDIEPPIISKRIKQAAKDKNISVSTMLHDLDISKNMLYYMDTRGSYPSIKALIQVCNYLLIDINTLLSDNTTPTPTISDAIDIIARTQGVSTDYIRGLLHLPIDNIGNTSL